MNKINSKGFTLIELLVVIAIIGILSTIAMTSLNGARKKAADAAFKSSVSSLQAIGVLCCDETSTLQPYTTTEATAKTVKKVCASTAVSGDYALSAFGGVVVTAPCTSGTFRLTASPATGVGTLTSGWCDETHCDFT